MPNEMSRPCTHGSLLKRDLSNLNLSVSLDPPIMAKVPNILSDQTISPHMPKIDLGLIRQVLLF